MPVYLFFAVSQAAKVFSAALSNYTAKKLLHGKKDTFFYNFAVFAMCAAVFAVAALFEDISLYTVILGIIFGVFTTLCNMYGLLALSEGPLNLTNLITTSSIIISSLSGVLLFGEHFSLGKFIATVCLVGFISLAVTKGEGGKTKIGKKWLLHCLIAFLAQGAVGVTQKIQQNSAFSQEMIPFLAVTFAVTALCSLLAAGKRKERTSFGKKHFLAAALCALCTVGMNYLNLALSGKLPSQFFFPFSAGCGVVLISTVSVVFFKEKLTLRQTVGLIGGIISLILICIF